MKVALTVNRKTSYIASVCVLAVSMQVVSCTSSDVHEGAANSSSQGTPPSPDFANIPNQFPQPPTNTSAGQDAAPVGACVSLSGKVPRANLSVVECGSPENNYKVIQRVTMPNECISDTDRRYYQNDANGGWTACLDLAWDKSTCLSITTTLVRRVSCSDTTVPNRQKPVKLITNTTTIEGCPRGGFVFDHPERRFTVCAETQR